MKSLSLTLSISAVLIAMTNWVSAQPNQTSELEQYLKITDALFHDNLKSAKGAAGKLASDHAKGTLSGPAGKVAAAANIAEAREAFQALSAEAIKLATGDKTYTMMHCPMVKGGKGDWLSTDGKVNNPYFGSKMPHCGGPKK